MERQASAGQAQRAKLSWVPEAVSQRRHLCTAHKADLGPEATGRQQGYQGPVSFCLRDLSQVLPEPHILVPKQEDVEVDRSWASQLL